MSQDPYEVLGVARDATQDDIKRAYRKLALQHHPDKNQGSAEAAEAFKRVNEAYAAVGDPAAREEHDRGGSGAAGIHMPDLHDILDGWFTGFHGMFPHMQMQQPQDALPVQVAVPITLEDVVYGSVKRVAVEATHLCAKCDGSGARSPHDIIQCITCKGRGMQMQQLAPGMFSQSTCRSCAGKRSTIRTGAACTSCTGTGTVAATQTLEVECPRGVPNGFQHTVPGLAGTCPHTRKPRDAVLRFEHQLPPDTRVDAATGDVHTVVPVPLESVLCGIHNLPVALYGTSPERALHLASRSYVDPSRTFTFPNHGLPVATSNASTRGTLHVTLRVVYPPPEKIVKFTDVLCKMFKHPPPPPSDTSTTTASNVLQLQP